MQCAKGPFARRPPTDWDRIQKECPNIVRNKVQSVENISISEPPNLNDKEESENFIPIEETNMLNNNDYYAYKYNNRESLKVQNNVYNFVKQQKSFLNNFSFYQDNLKQTFKNSNNNNYIIDGCSSNNRPTMDIYKFHKIMRF